MKKKLIMVEPVNNQLAKGNVLKLKWGTIEVNADPMPGRGREELTIHDNPPPKLLKGNVDNLSVDYVSECVLFEYTSSREKAFEEMEAEGKKGNVMDFKVFFKQNNLHISIELDNGSMVMGKKVVCRENNLN